MKSRVSIVKCNSYDFEEVFQAAEKAFEFIGGISSFIKNGEKVLIKPNILSGRPPQDGVNTHVDVARACVRLVKGCGAIPIIGDSPGGSVSPKEVYETSGFSSMAKDEGTELAEVKDVRMIDGIPFASYFFECDKIISVPKMKTHSLTTLTGAVKNMFGAVSGLNKSECHKRFPKPEGFSRLLVDVFEKVRPHLVLMDAVIAMDGDGPAAGRLRDVGLLLASQDSVAMDSVFAYLIGIDPYRILTTKEAAMRGLGQIDLENIEILGQGLKDSFIKNFKLPSSRIVIKLPDFIVETLAGFVRFRPYIKEEACKRCMICQKSCPLSAITISDKRCAMDYNKCIRCMCCHEVCPYGAVRLRRNILARAMGL
ncbi:MAG: DUF362 domain-containing protein [Candidatus Omnitrophica bacterium]|nr:DUF362 domain-containing protein [Candidatus Omnitrophota bacterium]MBU4590931.1 DUF362 domain-containing protein [Candidatus Omnitrophota bacterium]